MDERTKRHFKRGFTALLLLILLSSVYSIVKYGRVVAADLAMTVVGISAGVFVSYLLYRSFFERESQMTFLPGEEVILKRVRPDKSVILPQIINDKNADTSPPQDVNLYLTTIGLAAEVPGSGEPILYIPFRDIQEMQTLNRMLLKYIRIRYVDIHRLTSEILVYVGNDTDVWAENIGRMLVSQI